MKKEPLVEPQYGGRLDFWLLVAMILDKQRMEGKLKSPPKNKKE